MKARSRPWTVKLFSQLLAAVLMAASLVTATPSHAKENSAVRSPGKASWSSAQALQECLKLPGARNGLLSLMARPSSGALAVLIVDAQAEARRVELLRRAVAAGVCPESRVKGRAN